MSPDGKRGVFIRDWNLWVRDVASGTEKKLTSDGVKYFGYATDPAPAGRAAIARWCSGRPTRSKIATQQQDGRNVGEMYLVPTGTGHPTLNACRKCRFPATPRWRCSIAS